MERYLAEHLFIPLGMKSTWHTLPGAFRRGVELSPKSRIEGLFSSANDLGIFAQMLLNRGVYNHRRYFKFETVDTFTGSEIPWSKPSASDWTAKVFSPKLLDISQTPGLSCGWIRPESYSLFCWPTGYRRTEAFRKLKGKSVNPSFHPFKISDFLAIANRQSKSCFLCPSILISRKLFRLALRQCTDSHSAARRRKDDAHSTSPL